MNKTVNSSNDIIIITDTITRGFLPSLPAKEIINAQPLPRGGHLCKGHKFWFQNVKYKLSQYFFFLHFFGITHNQINDNTLTKQLYVTK